MKVIIVATDFSATASTAVHYAAAMAESIGAGLFVVHFYQLPLLPYEVPIVPDIELETRRYENALNNMRAEIMQTTQNKIQITTRVIISAFYDGLRELCEEVKPYAVVLGSQGTTATERFLMGGHTVYAMKHLPWPLITVPRGASFSTIKRIGLACDLEDLPASTPIEELMILVKDFHAELHILNIGKADDFDAHVVFNASALSRITSDIEPTFHFLTHSDTDRGIIEFAEQHKMDLLIILPRRHGILYNLLHRSHTKDFVLHSFVPVMALH